MKRSFKWSLNKIIPNLRIWKKYSKNSQNHQVFQKAWEFMLRLLSNEQNIQKTTRKWVFLWFAKVVKTGIPVSKTLIKPMENWHFHDQHKNHWKPLEILDFLHAKNLADLRVLKRYLKDHLNIFPALSQISLEMIF